MATRKTDAAAQGNRRAEARRPSGGPHSQAPKRGQQLGGTILEDEWAHRLHPRGGAQRRPGRARRPHHPPGAVP